MANLLEQTIDCKDAERAARIIQDALCIESDEVTNYAFPKRWPANREQRARIIGELHVAAGIGTNSEVFYGQTRSA
jgi:hypothetical protein